MTEFESFISFWLISVFFFIAAWFCFWHTACLSARWNNLILAKKNCFRPRFFKHFWSDFIAFCGREIEGTAGAFLLNSFWHIPGIPCCLIYIWKTPPYAYKRKYPRWGGSVSKTSFGALKVVQVAWALRSWRNFNKRRIDVSQKKHTECLLFRQGICLEPVKAIGKVVLSTSR